MQIIMALKIVFNLLTNLKLEVPTVINISRWGLVESPYTTDPQDKSIPLKPEVLEWLSYNCKGKYKAWWEIRDYPIVTYFIKFDKREDAVAFKMIWYC